MDLREAGCEDGRWMELAQDHVQWRVFGTFFCDYSGELTVIILSVHCKTTSREFVVPHGPPGEHPCIVAWRVMSVAVPLSPRVLRSESSAAGIRK
jgi:hypothetical protein